MDSAVLTNPVLIWFLVGLVMLVAELLASGLIIFFFGVGAWVVAIVTAVVPLGINSQLLLFIISSGASLVLFRCWLRPVFHGHIRNRQDPSRDLDDFTGHKGIVTGAITSEQSGQVDFRGTTWEAEADEDIPAGTSVEIVDKKNITLRVKKI